MAVELVEGPRWTSGGMLERAGRYPLRVESAVTRLVEKLLPGVITTTRHARHYTVHLLARAAAVDRNLDPEKADELGRRCDVIVAGVHSVHRSHRRLLPPPHGRDQLHRFVDGERLDVEAAARPNGLSAAGFAGIYVGPLAQMGFLTRGPFPRPGPRASLEPIRKGLDGLIELAQQDKVSLADLRAASHLCPCEASEAPDGAWLLTAMFDPALAEDEHDRSRVATCQMLLEALSPDGAVDPGRAFRRAHGFGVPDDDGTERALIRESWRAAVLRNYSVGAWRELWRWLTKQLAEPMTAAELADRFASQVGEESVSDFIADLPARTEGRQLLPVEEELRRLEAGPRRCLSLLVLGALRLDDFDGRTLQAFRGLAIDAELSPTWVAKLLDERRGDRLPAVARDLTDVLVRRAKRVAHSKMEMIDGEVVIPTRLRDRGGILTVVGEEGAGEVALRQSSLAEILTGLGLIERSEDDIHRLTERGEELRGRGQ
jgi:hypothetical protein